jgi:hypothetical protein
LRHRDVAEEVDVEQAAPLGERQRLHGRVDLDSGVVDEGAQRTAVGVVGDALHEHRDLGLVGDVESARLDIRGSDSVGVGIPTYAGEDVKAALGEFAGGGGADSRRGPGHHDERMTEGGCLFELSLQKSVDFGAAHQICIHTRTDFRLYATDSMQPRRSMM